MESLLVDSAKKTEGIIQDSPSPFVLLKRFDNYAAVYELRAYTNNANEYLKIQSEIKRLEKIFTTCSRKWLRPYSSASTNKHG